MLGLALSGTGATETRAMATHCKSSPAATRHPLQKVSVPRSRSERGGRRFTEIFGKIFETRIKEQFYRASPSTQHVRYAHRSEHAY